MTDMFDAGQTSIAQIKLPAILIGGPPNAGKSVLTYNLTQELRRRDIDHYVFRANPDIEGDWFLREEQENVRSIHVSFQQYRKWDGEFRDLVCHDLRRRRHLPLIVDLGGYPNDEDLCIFRACTHSILLLKEEEENLSRSWINYSRDNDLFPIAEVTSKLDGTSIFTSRKPMIKGTLTGLVRGVQYIPGPTFEAILEYVSDLFSSYPRAELKRLHLESAPGEPESVIDLDSYLQVQDPGAFEWTYDMLEPFLADLSVRGPMAVYGRGPCWLYGALALHAEKEGFYQFDARLGWVSAPELRAGTLTLPSEGPLHIEPPYRDEDQYLIEMHPRHNYIDYTDAPKLAFPELSPDRGVIISGKLPFWLFTALARFYANLHIPWIALTDAHNNAAIVIHSEVEEYHIGDPLRMPV